MKYQHLLLILCVSLILSCTGKNEFKTTQLGFFQDFIIFGSVFPGCQEGDRLLFLLTEDALRRCVDDYNYNTSCKRTPFIDIPLDHKDFHRASVLFKVPKSLLENDIKSEYLDVTIGCGDYFIFGRVDGQSFELSTDDITSSAPPDLIKYFKTFQRLYGSLI